MTQDNENILAGCPRCGGPVSVNKLRCNKCRINTELPEENDFVPRMATLPQRDMAFLQLFVELDGNIKAVAQALSVSMPTVKKRLEQIKLYLREVERYDN